MSEDVQYRDLTAAEIETLKSQGATAEDWSNVQVTDGFDPQRVRNAHFAGRTRIGATLGEIECDGGFLRPAGIYDATMKDCEVGCGTRIANVKRYIANYRIGDETLIENVDIIASAPDATFGNGVELEALNEGGGREFRLFEGLTSQWAYLEAAYRDRPQLAEKMQAMVTAEIESAAKRGAYIGGHVRVVDSGPIIDVCIADRASVCGAANLENGTVMSDADDATVIGNGVSASGFIAAPGARITGGAMLSDVFVGQATQIGKQFSAENSVFFANCEAFHGEACSIFAGPNTVTHHKSSLLIAGLFSFYNAGSGTNQSNHMYKLGPVHQGIVERGCKTGSFAYLLWPSHVGPFTVVMGKNAVSFDASRLPFSYISAESDGHTYLVPAMNLYTVGVVRDGIKWPDRDRRKGRKRDLVHFGVYTPYSVQRMIDGQEELQTLIDETDRSVETCIYHGLHIKRLLLRNGRKYYETAINRYLLEKALDRFEKAAGNASSWADVLDRLRPSPDAVADTEWTDVCGMLVARERVNRLVEAIEAGEIDTMEKFARACEACYEAFEEDEWAYVVATYEKRTGAKLTEASPEDVARMADELEKVSTRATRMILADAEKEFGDSAKIGYGLNGGPDALEADFQAVRGTFDGNSFVRQMNDDLGNLQDRLQRLKKAIQDL